MNYGLVAFSRKHIKGLYVNDYTPNGVVVVVVTTVVTAKVLAVVSKEYLLLVFHIVFQK